MPRNSALCYHLTLINFQNSFCWCQNLELQHVEEASGYQIHANTEPEGCRKAKSEEFEIGGAKIVFLPKIDVLGKTVVLAPLVMGRPKLELHRVEEASGYQIHANTEPEGCRKAKSEEFEIGGAKIVFLPKIDVFGKTVVLAPLVMGRPKLELHHVEDVWPFFRFILSINFLFFNFDLFLATLFCCLRFRGNVCFF